MKNTIDMAREVKATAYTNRHYPDRTTYTFGPEQLKDFEALVRADERNRTWTQEHWTEYEQSIAAAERKRLHDKFMEIHKMQQHSNNYWHFAARKIMEE